MSNIVKYGKYFISAGIAIGGAVWLQRPKDVRVKGEDTADLYGAVQDCVVVPYLVGEALPDWQAANDGKTTTVGAAIAYCDIQTIGMRARHLWTKNGSILWTTNLFSVDTIEPAKMLGGHSFTNTDFGIVDTLNVNGIMVTNRYYSYATNTYADSLVTTATRCFTNNMKFEPWIINTEINNAVSITSSNFPVTPNVFASMTATSLLNHLAYKSWPYTWSHAYPWEQWSYPTKSRISVSQISGYNITWPDIAWIGTNSLSVSLTPSAANTNFAGYSMATLQDVNGNTSVPFVFLFRSKMPPSDPYYTFEGIKMMNDSDYITTFTLGSHSPLLNLQIAKHASGAGAFIRATVPVGTTNFIPPFQVSGNASSSTMAFSNHYASAWGVVKYTAYANSTTNLPMTNVSPIYTYVRFSNDAWTGTNAYFNVTAPAYLDPSISVQATTNAVTRTFKATDDLRISTNKLNGLAQVITNLYRTVYFGGVGTLVATNRICQRTDTFFNGLGNIYYVEEFMDGNVEEDPSYYDFGDPSQYIPTFIATAGTDTYTNENTDVREVYSEELQYWAYKQGQRYSYAPDPGGGWNSYTGIEGNGYEKLEYSYKGVTPVYPSLYAVTNGYVKKVTVYAVYAVTVGWQPSYIAQPYDGFWPDKYAHDVGGNYWTTYNTGLAITGKTLSTPTDAIPDTRVKYLHRTYPSTLKNRAVYCKIAEIDNPTEKIIFDIERATVTGINFAARHAYSFATNDDGADDNWNELFTWNYSSGASITMEQFMIVVDWKFQHLGRGFTP